MQQQPYGQRHTQPYQVTAARQTDTLSVKQVKEPTWRGHQQVCATPQLQDLLCHVAATCSTAHCQLSARCHGRSQGGCLLCVLARWTQNNCQWQGLIARKQPLG